jgi:hypothetical protein
VKAAKILNQILLHNRSHFGGADGMIQHCVKVFNKVHFSVTRDLVALKGKGKGKVVLVLNEAPRHEHV